MGLAKARTLKVGPVQSSDLAFNMAGVIEQHYRDVAVLGGRVTGFSYTQLYEALLDADDSGRLRFDAGTIRRQLEAARAALFALRAEAVATSLERMIRQRQNAFLQSYKHSDTIAREYARLYPPTPADPAFSTSKLGRLEQIATQVDQRHAQIRDAYTADGQTTVMSATTTTSTGSSNANSSSTGEESGTSTSVTTSTGTTDMKGSATETSDSTQKNNSDTEVGSLPGGSRATGETSNFIETPQVWDGSDWRELRLTDPTFINQKMHATGGAESHTTGSSESKSLTTSTGDARGESSSASKSRTTANTTSDYANSTRQSLVEYRHPLLENDLQAQRRHLDLQDETLQHKLVALRVPHLPTLLANELEMLDLDVKQLQLNYLHTFLISPISGLITGIYKDVGESVQPGEPVLRVENDEEVFVTGRINYRGRLDVGAAVTLTVQAAFEAAENVTLTGKLVAVRGHDADNDEWNVIFRCDNRAGVDPAARKLPLNYTFDYNDVSVVIG